MMPIRVQRCRTKGWRLPDNTLYVGRPTRWGNPFVPGRIHITGYTPNGNALCITPRSIRECVDFYREYIAQKQENTIKIHLHGKNLAC